MQGLQVIVAAVNYEEFLPDRENLTRCHLLPNNIKTLFSMRTLFSNDLLKNVCN